jgi:hypothetical protein
LGFSPCALFFARKQASCRMRHWQTLESPDDGAG